MDRERAADVLLEIHRRGGEAADALPAFIYTGLADMGRKRRAVVDDDLIEKVSTWLVHQRELRKVKTLEKALVVVATSFLKGRQAEGATEMSVVSSTVLVKVPMLLPPNGSRQRKCILGSGLPALREDVSAGLIEATNMKEVDLRLSSSCTCRYFRTLKFVASASKVDQRGLDQRGLDEALDAAVHKAVETRVVHATCTLPHGPALCHALFGSRHLPTSNNQVLTMIRDAVKLSCDDMFVTVGVEQSVDEASVERTISAGSGDIRGQETLEATQQVLDNFCTRLRLHEVTVPVEKDLVGRIVGQSGRGMKNAHMNLAGNGLTGLKGTFIGDGAIFVDGTSDEQRLTCAWLSMYLRPGREKEERLQETIRLGISNLLKSMKKAAQAKAAKSAKWQAYVARRMARNRTRRARARDARRIANFGCFLDTNYIKPHPHTVLSSSSSNYIEVGRRTEKRERDKRKDSKNKEKTPSKEPRSSYRERDKRKYSKNKEKTPSTEQRSSYRKTGAVRGAVASQADLVLSE